MELTAIHVLKHKGNAVRVKLKHDSNPDIDGGYWTPPLDKGRAKFVTVSTFAEASEVCRAYIKRNELGGGNWTGGQVFDDNRQIARVSYNGRVWDRDDNEITR